MNSTAPTSRRAMSQSPASLSDVPVPAADSGVDAAVGTSGGTAGTGSGRELLRPRSVVPIPLSVLAHRAGASAGADAGAGAGADVRVTGVTLDSRAVLPGDLYAALPGTRVHGAEFIPSAAAAGATAVLTDARGAPAAVTAGLPALVADDPRAVLGSVAAAVYGDPTRGLRLLGVTGTNGKTTVCYLLEAGLAAAGYRTGLVGTIETRVAGRSVPSARTTPEAPDLQAMFAAMVEQGVSAAAMEVSSHALALHRVDACHFAAAGFTNLSQDHLDFHPTMADYLAAKAELFRPERSARAVVSVDDEAGRTLFGQRPDAVTVSTRSRPDRTVYEDADAQAPSSVHAQWLAVEITLDAQGSTFRLLGPGVDRRVRLRLPGAFNVSNALVALVVLHEAGVDLDAAVPGVERLAGVPGRMERVDAGQPWLAIVDYAHTPTAVATLLASVRPLVTGRVIVVLGCGGDRDRGKRPLMGAAAAERADLVVLTSDNPRSEDPGSIVAAMLEGVQGVVPADRAEVSTELDRAAAIALAVDRARPGDAVVVAGKGHETGQDTAGTVAPFDDRTVLRRAIAVSGQGGDAQ